MLTSLSGSFPSELVEFAVLLCDFKQLACLKGSFVEKGVRATSLSLAVLNINNKASFSSCSIGMWEQDNKISPAYHFSLEFGQSL